MFSRLLTVLSLAALLSGCLVKNFDHSSKENLTATLDNYADVVRWGNLTRMYSFAGPHVHWTVQPGLNNITITDYDASPPRKIKPGLWRSTAVIGYVQDDRQVVRHLVDRQLWASDDEGQTWYRKNPPPRF